MREPLRPYDRKLLSLLAEGLLPHEIAAELGMPYAAADIAQRLAMLTAPNEASRSAIQEAVTYARAAPILADGNAIEIAAQQIRVREAALELVEASRPANPIRVLKRDDLAALHPPKPIVDGLIYTETVVTLAASGGTGKTALAIDWAMCMGTNERFLGRSVKQGKVLFIAAEGLHSFDRRMKAWEQSRGLELGSAGKNIDTVPGVTLNTATLRELEKMQQEEKYGLIVLDTRSTLFDIDNENDNARMSAIYKQLRSLLNVVPGSCVLVLAHVTEQTDAKGRKSTKLRGASAARDDSDTVVIASGSKDSFTLSTRKEDGAKQRDAAEVLVPNLRLMSVGGGVVVTNVSEDEQESNDRIVRDRARTLDPDETYSSSSLQIALGLTSKGLYEAWRTRAVELGVIEKTGPSQKAPYRIRSSSVSDQIKAA
jgi:hypothetical protein